MNRYGRLYRVGYNWKQVFACLPLKVYVVGACPILEGAAALLLLCKYCVQRTG